jgi:FkbM family methyltransferase
MRAYLFDVYANRSYSQEGEDMILRRIFEEQKCGFYVDVGAHHPRRFSNTYFFYKLGWSGINIDAMPGSMRGFSRLRPRDINIECAIGNTKQLARYFVFNEPAFNSFDEKLSRGRNTGPYHIVQELIIPIRPLREILKEHIPYGQAVDFLTIDVEGMDLEVLLSNDWQAYRPRYILVECFNLSLYKPIEDPIYNFLSAKNYHLFAKTVHTAIFRDTEHAESVEPF